MAVRQATLDKLGTLIEATDGFNTSGGGGMTVTAGFLLRGPNCVRCNWTASANITNTINDISGSDVRISFYFSVATGPTATCRVAQFQNGSTQFDIRLLTTPTLQFRWGTTTLYTTPTLNLNQLYRFGIRYKCESSLGAADGIMEVYMANADEDFGAAKASSTVVTMTTSNAAINFFNFGHSNAGSVSGDIYFDDIRITDEQYMPGVSVAPPPPFPLVATVYHM